jgi:signal transduction histidine kinase
LPQTHRIVKKSIENAVYINVDRKQLIKSIYYIAQYVVDRTPEGSLIDMSVNRATDTFSVEISIAYEGNGSLHEDKQNFLRPLLDFKNLETELNLPIAHKIIEGHHGTLDVKREGKNNIFMIILPIFDRRGSAASFKGGYVNEQ